MNSSVLNFFESIVYGVARLFNRVIYFFADLLTLSS